MKTPPASLSSPSTIPSPDTANVASVQDSQKNNSLANPSDGKKPQLTKEHPLYSGTQRPAFAKKFDATRSRSGESSEMPGPQTKTSPDGSSSDGSLFKLPLNTAKRHQPPPLVVMTSMDKESADFRESPTKMNEDELARTPSSALPTTPSTGGRSPKPRHPNVSPEAIRDRFLGRQDPFDVALARLQMDLAAKGQLGTPPQSDSPQKKDDPQ